MSESFILQGYIEDLSLCDRIIQAHNDTPNKKPGIMGPSAGVRTVDKTVKDSIDTSLNGALLDEYVTQLKPIIRAYIDKYPQCNMFDPWGITAHPNVQHYKPGGGYFAWHCERSTAKDAHTSSRHLVFMTYLNDVTDGGETEFQLQNIKVQPRKGLSLIWPADWTHTHRGVTSMTQDKYIVTGWFNFM